MNEERIEMIKLYYDEFKYRHEHFWSLFYKSTYIIIILISAPFILSFDGLEAERLKNIMKYNIFLFPLISIVFSIISTIILLSEYERLSLISKKYNDLKADDYKVLRIDEKGFKRVYKLKIGIIMPVILLFTMIIISIIELVVLLIK